jgi:hypothetical protein
MKPVMAKDIRAIHVMTFRRIEGDVNNRFFTKVLATDKNRNTTDQKA